MVFGNCQLYVKMAKIKGFEQLKRVLSRVDSDVETIIKAVMLEYMQKIFNEALSNLPSSASSIRESYKLEVSEGGFRITIYTDNDFAAYIEFGTGEFAKAYLAGEPQEVTEEAIKFYINGEGKMPERPYLFPAYYKYKDEMIEAMNRKIQVLLRYA